MWFKEHPWVFPGIIGGIWNVISLWVRRGMKDKPEDVRSAIQQYLSRMGSTTANAPQMV